MSLYLHIPKTAGTALRNSFRMDENKYKIKPFNVAVIHEVTLYNTNRQVFFSLRDPLKRFCSGYWERYTNVRRKELNSRAPAKFQGEGYQDLSRVEEMIFNLYPTPNDLITAIREHKINYAQHDISGHQLNLLLSPLTLWTGKLELFRLHEHKIGAVFHQKNLSSIMKNTFNIDMPQDSFLMRSRDQFPDLEQSYEISDVNRIWFTNYFRRSDYQIIEYIKTRPYYIDS